MTKGSIKSLTTGSIPKHVATIALPASIGLFFQTMYNVVDSFYAGQISTKALAAMSLSFPVFLLVIATSSGLSRGSSALIANAIGAEEFDRSRRFVAQSGSLAIIVSISMTVFGLLVAAPLFRVLGAEGEYLSLANEYITPIFIGSCFFVLSSLANAILVAGGDSFTFSKVLVIGFFANLILDPWFLYGGYGLPPMGLAGIAWATVLIQVASCIWLWRKVFRSGFLSAENESDSNSNSDDSLSEVVTSDSTEKRNLDEHGSLFRSLIPDLRVYFEIMQQAIPASFNVMSVAVGFFTINFFIKQFGEETVAAFGVGTRIEQIGLMPTFGLYASIMALVGQNNGAKDFARVREAMRVCNIAGFVLSITTSTLILVFDDLLFGLFTDDSKVIEVGKHYLWIQMIIMWSYVMTSTHLAFLQAIKRPNYGFFETVLRKVALPLLLIFLFIGAFPNGNADNIWYGVAIANVLMTIVTVLYANSIKLQSDSNPVEPA